MIMMSWSRALEGEDAFQEMSFPTDQYSSVPSISRQFRLARLQGLELTTEQRNQRKQLLCLISGCLFYDQEDFPSRIEVNPFPFRIN